MHHGKKWRNILDFNMVKTKKIHEFLFLEEWSTHAYITEDGEVYIQLTLGKCFTKDQWLKEIEGQGWNEEMFNRRIKLFDELIDKYKHLKL